MFRPRLRTIAAAGIGAAAAYLWDPDQGPERRARLSEQLRALTQGAGTDATTPWIDTASTPPSDVRNAATGGPAATSEQVDAVDGPPVLSGSSTANGS
jgi:hypothetical protein